MEKKLELNFDQFRQMLVNKCLNGAEEVSPYKTNHSFIKEEVKRFKYNGVKENILHHTLK